MLLQPTPIESQRPDQRKPAWGLWSHHWLIQSRKNSASFLFSVIKPVSANRKVFTSSRFYNKLNQRCKMWSPGPSLLSLFTLLHHKKKVMECKCSIHVKSSPGCVTDRNMKHYHLRAKWCVCVCVCVSTEQFSEQFFLNPPFPALYNHLEISNNKCHASYFLLCDNASVCFLPFPLS